jgi:hypothetical protein
VLSKQSKGLVPASNYRLINLLNINRLSTQDNRKYILMSRLEFPICPCFVCDCK